MSSFFRSDEKQPDEIPIGYKALFALGTAASVLGITSVIYKYFSRSNAPVSKHKVKAVLGEILQSWSSALRQMSAQEQQLAARGGISAAEMQMIAMYMQGQLQDAFARSEEEALQNHRVSKRQMKTACEEYSNDPEIASKVNQIKQLINMVNPVEKPLPDHITLDYSILHIKAILDMTITSMEEVYKALGGDNLPRSLVVSPDFIQQLNKSYAKIFTARRMEYYENNDLSEDLVSQMSEIYSVEPTFREMLSQHQIEKRDAYARMGIMNPMN